MKSILADGQLYIDVRPCSDRGELSFDLSRHLPRRMKTGTAVVIAENPSVFLSVVRKRLAKLLYEIERERARTLQRDKRDSLAAEILRLRTYRFAAKPSLEALQPDALFVPANYATHGLPEHSTLYVTVEMSGRELCNALSKLTPGGLLVIYGEWLEEYEQAVNDFIASTEASR